MIPTPAVKNRGLALALQIPALCAMLRKHRPAILLSAGNQSNLSIAIAARLAGGKTAVFQKITNPAVRPGPPGRWQYFRNWRFGVTARLGTRTLVLSNADVAISAALAPAAADRFVMVNNPYVTEAMLALGRSRAASKFNAIPVLLSVARLDLQKDHETMLAALARITSRAWTLTLVGDGPFRAHLTALVERLGLSDRVNFAGFVEDATPYYAAADLLILSSRWEGLPATPIEALASGCAVVATNCAPGLCELLADAGLPKTVPIGDPAALADAIMTALDQPCELGTARAVAARYTVRASIDGHLALFAPWLPTNIKGP